MKKSMKVITVSLLAVIVSSTLFAQSNENNQISINALTNSTNNIQNISTNVQYFNDISENYLGTIEINSNKPNLSLSASFKFDSFFIGSYLSGSLWGNTHHILITQNNIKAQAEYKDNLINGELLIGSKNFAGKVNFGVLINENSKKTPVNIEENTYDNSLQTLLTLGGEFGGSFDFNNFCWKPVIGYSYANSLIYRFDSKNTKENKDLEVKTNLIKIGSDFLIKGHKETNHKIGTNILINIPTAKPRKTTENNFLDINTCIPLFEPYYENFFDTDKVSIKTKLDIVIGGGKIKALDPNYHELVEESNIFILNPSFDIDCVYNVNKENFSLNLGANVNLPYFIKLSQANHINRTTINETITSNILATFRTGFDLLLSKNTAVNLNTVIPLSPTLSKTIIDNISLSFTFRK